MTRTLIDIQRQMNTLENINTYILDSIQELIEASVTEGVIEDVSKFWNTVDGLLGSMYRLSKNKDE